MRGFIATAPTYAQNLAGSTKSRISLCIDFLRIWARQGFHRKLAHRNLLAERRCLLARIQRIEARLAVTAGTRAGRVHGYPATGERHTKTIRIQAFRTRLAEVEQQLGTGRVSVCRGGKALLHMRNHLADACGTETQWRMRWAASRLFLTADGEKGKTCRRPVEAPFSTK